MSTYNIVASTDENTVVTEYVAGGYRAECYQSEADLEREFIRLLSSQGYEHLNVPNEAALIANLRKQLQTLNNFLFTDSEWDRFFSESISNPNEGIVEKTRKIQDDYVQVLRKDDGTTKNIYLLDKKNVHNNRLQVLNQYEEVGGKHKARYDVTILVNGFPLVHIELKRRGIAIREAFNQIERYQRESFWAQSGLYEYVQIFVISNGTHTKYYSNTTRNSHIKEQSSSERRKSMKTSHSFEFTSYWADANNKVIPDLVDFTKTFFARHTLLNILTKYCVFTSEELLLVMRPYQIAATERILSRILIATNYKKTGTIEAGGFVWHTTGSGKTLTSFKTAQLASAMPYIDKVLFIVDRKDLDYQTMKEYDRFEKGAADGNTSTKILQRQLENKDERGNPRDYKIIVTTIQKLDIFISKNKHHDIYKKHVVLIFDECHRSQFGKMHRVIVKSFKNYHIFGFTGTPIFPQNAPIGKNVHFTTTEQAFGNKIHSYTIVDAINDGNVLPFRIDYINTMKRAEAINDKSVRAIDEKKALEDPERVSYIVGYVLQHFDQKTNRSSVYTLSAEKHREKRVAGFNSIFAASSIPMAMKYYQEFKEQIAKNKRNLKLATIFSFSANEETIDTLLPDEDLDTSKLDKSSRDFLESAIADYNSMFGTKYDTSSDRYQNYYKDISLRMKNRDLDLLIVVNMFLTGFDATTLNTLWMDKNLRQHGLLQAFSRTNRILNSIKTFGNIICFRKLQNETDEAIALFGNKEAGGIVLLKTFDEYYNGYTENGKQKPGYKELIAELVSMYQLGQDIIGEDAKKSFVQLFGAILKLRNILSAFDDFDGKEILTHRELQDYQSKYLDIYQEIKNVISSDKESINDDIIFEIELVKQIEVNVDYILMLVAQYKDSLCKDKTILVNIDKAINSSIELRSKKDLIDRFIERVNAETDVLQDWETYINERKEADLRSIITEENLKPEETRNFVTKAFRDGTIRASGTAIDAIMQPLSRFNNGGRAAKKQNVIDRLIGFFEKYFGLV